MHMPAKTALDPVGFDKNLILRTFTFLYWTCDANNFDNLAVTYYSTLYMTLKI
jgi:hypothetical protein